MRTYPGGSPFHLFYPEAPKPLSQVTSPTLLNTMPQLTKKNVSILNIEPWEEFLDFSRWRTPATSVITKRLIDNALTYSVRLSFALQFCALYTFSVCPKSTSQSLTYMNMLQGQLLVDVVRDNVTLGLGGELVDHWFFLFDSC